MGEHAEHYHSTEGLANQARGLLRFLSSRSFWTALITGGGAGRRPRSQVLIWRMPSGWLVVRSKGFLLRRKCGVRHSR